jgi:hypothetical protein
MLKYLFGLFICIGALNVSAGVEINSGLITLKMNDRGRMTALSYKGEDVLNKKTTTNLLTAELYSKGGLRAADSMKVVSRTDNKTIVDLAYGSSTIRVEITAQGEWLRFKIIGGDLSDVKRITWGPYKTNISKSVAGFFGILYSDTFAMGLMSLDTNTDGRGYGTTMCAEWLPYPKKGSSVYLESWDHTRPYQFRPYRTVKPTPGFTVKNSAVALYFAPSDKKKLLACIEKIVKKEGLPYLKYKGEWNKVSKKISAPSVWAHFSEKTASQVIKIAKDLSANNICAFSNMFGNWGHFDLSKRLYPSGMDGIHKIAQEAKENNLNFTMYTLTNFIKPKDGVPEPYITPVVDPRFCRYDIKSKLVNPLSLKDKTIKLKYTAELEKFLNKVKPTMMEINNELIEFSQYKTVGENIEFYIDKRGVLMTKPKEHAGNSEVEFIYFAGYRNLFPGTIKMSREVAVNIGNKAKEGHFDKITLDGHESTQQTGYGPFSGNDTLKTIYEINKDREMIYTGSNMSNYCWNIISYISWGEFDVLKGFRGTMLDYRIRRQLQLGRNLMPKKLGQHYPSKATAEDLNWLMGQAVGWDSGVEFDIDIKSFNANPEHDEICRVVRLWEKARISGTLTEKQKMLLRQTDCVFSIKPAANNSWEISLIKRWTHPRCKKLKSSVIALTPAKKETKAKKCSIDLSWTHSPLVLDAAAVSDDIPLFVGEENKWSVKYPGKGRADINRKQFKFVLRVPENSPCGIKNPLIRARNQVFQVPTTLKPGEYMATPLHIPMVFVYDAKTHKVKREIPISFRNDLPDIGGCVAFDFSVNFESEKKGETPIALFNLFYAETMNVANYGASLAAPPIDYNKNNIALGCTVTASTGSEGNHKPAKAVDGKRNLSAAWHGAPGENRWFQVDLGSTKLIESVHTLFYWDGSRYCTYSVELSNDGKEWKKIAEVTSKKPATKMGILHKFKPRKARYVRLTNIVNSANKSCHLLELSVFEKGKTPKKSQ